MGRRPRSGEAEADATEDVGVQLLLSFALLESAAPVGGSELEDAVAGPAGQQAEQVAEVAEGLDVVEPAARYERDEGGVRLGAVLAADEEPADVVVQGEAPVGEEMLERLALVERVADALRDGRLVMHQSKKSRTMGRDLSCRAASFFFLGAPATARSILNSAPIRASANLARSGSDSSALKKLRRQCALSRARDKNHGRKKFRDAEDTQPILAAEGGAFLGAIYGEEEKARNLGLVGDALRVHRQRCIRPIVHDFERWLDAVDSSSRGP